MQLWVKDCGDGVVSPTKEVVRAFVVVEAVLLAASLSEGGLSNFHWHP